MVLEKVKVQKVLSVIRVTDIIYKNLDKSIPLAVAFLDLAKAFDTVNNKLLIEKCEYILIRRSPLYYHFIHHFNDQTDHFKNRLV